MPQITMLVGNGFDINIGLKTKYTQFEEFLLQKSKKKQSVYAQYSDLLEFMEEDPSEIWSDAEIAFGKFPAMITDSGHLADIYFDSISFFKEELSEYMKRIDNEAKKILRDNRATVVCNNFKIKNYYTELTEVQKEKLSNFLEPDKVVFNFINFNYTKTLEYFLDFQSEVSIFRHRPGQPVRYPMYGKLMHVHGYYDRNMVFGLNDDSQVEQGEVLKQNRPIYYDELIKEEANIVFEERTEEKAVNLLNTSDVLILFGLSIGDSDKRWWVRIGDWMRERKGKRIVFLQVQDLELPTISRARYREEVDNKRIEFLTKCSLTQEEILEYKDYVYVIKKNFFECLSGITKEAPRMAEESD